MSYVRVPFIRESYCKKARGNTDITEDDPVAALTPTPLDFSSALARLGLDQYESRLRENGFEDWDDMTEIQESDMTALGFKIGHRRKLQRAIRELSSSSASQTDDGTSNLIASVGPSNMGEQSDTTSRSSRQTVRPTRQYRRHPKADPNTPQKPKTAYVLFGEQVRQEPALSRLSFVEIAREVGKRWRELRPEERVNTWESPAADRLKEYKEEIERYKQTDDYQNYQLYLEAFKQGRQDTELMRPPDNKASSVSEPSPSTQLPSTQDQMRHEPTTQDNLDTDMTYEESSRDTISPVETGLNEVRRILRALGVNSNLIRVAAFPPENTTVKAVESFLCGTGSLLYFWSQDEALDLISVESARILMLAALDIGRHAFTSRFLGTDPSGEEARYWWSVFRSIIFLESCFILSRTLEMDQKLSMNMLIIFNDIREVLVSPVYRAMRESQIAVKDVANVAPGYYDAVEGAEDVSKNILDLTGRIMRVLQESLSL
ncbi:hypothetical protein N0V94_003127 [Neodidymelliopsis sp. IMI 364377]|nr:hypothetical protein N0V94_003127 [Neodidymelliopsis sp. IMI 364377]